MVFHLLVLIPLRRRVRTWRIWHEALAILGMVVLLGLCNFFLASVVVDFPIRLAYCLVFVYWTLLIGVIVCSVSIAVSYHRSLPTGCLRLKGKIVDREIFRSGNVMEIDESRGV